MTAEGANTTAAQHTTQRNSSHQQRSYKSVRSALYRHLALGCPARTPLLSTRLAPPSSLSHSPVRPVTYTWRDICQQWCSDKQTAQLERDKRMGRGKEGTGACTYIPCVSVLLDAPFSSRRHRLCAVAVHLVFALAGTAIASASSVTNRLLSAPPVPPEQSSCYTRTSEK